LRQNGPLGELQTMPTSDMPPAGRWPKLVLRRADQAVSAALIALSLVAIAGWMIGQGHLRGRLIDIDRAEPVPIDFKIDVNRADWPELALMPGIGEQLAKRIVASRQSKGPFRELSDLRRVRGIGPKTLDGIKPYLLPLADSETTAGEKADIRRPAAGN
jgi:competence protein ComEA